MDISDDSADEGPAKGQASARPAAVPRARVCAEEKAGGSERKRSSAVSRGALRAANKRFFTARRDADAKDLPDFSTVSSAPARENTPPRTLTSSGGSTSAECGDDGYTISLSDKLAISGKSKTDFREVSSASARKDTPSRNLTSSGGSTTAECGDDGYTISLSDKLAISGESLSGAGDICKGKELPSSHMLAVSVSENGVGADDESFVLFHNSVPVVPISEDTSHDDEYEITSRCANAFILPSSVGDRPSDLDTFAVNFVDSVLALDAEDEDDDFVITSHPHVQRQVERTVEGSTHSSAHSGQPANKPSSGRATSDQDSEIDDGFFFTPTALTQKYFRSDAGSNTPPSAWTATEDEVLGDIISRCFGASLPALGAAAAETEGKGGGCSTDDDDFELGGSVFRRG